MPPLFFPDHSRQNKKVERPLRVPAFSALKQELTS